MNKEKNGQKIEPKKESTSVLEKIRRRTGLLVGIVGLALVIFILESLLGSGASIFGGSEMSYAGTISGKKIDRNEFVMKLENYLNNYRQRNQGKEADEATRKQAIESIWQQYIVDLVMMPQFKEIGINIGEDELYETVVVNPVSTIIQNLSDQNGKLNEQFAAPDGSLDRAKWRQAVQSVTGENEMAVRSMEEQVKASRYFEKFRSLISKGLYVTKVEAKERLANQNEKREVSYVIKRFDSVNDSTIKVSDSDIEKYYNENLFRYKNTETVRSIEYVSFNVTPSPEDLVAIEKDAQRAANDFKANPIKEDSSFIGQESENGTILLQNFTKKSMIIRDSSIYTSAPGTVFGPYNEGAYFKIYKLEAINSIADSARVRHILVGTADPQTQQPKRSLPQAKREADSLLTLIKEKKVSFDSLVANYSDDLGSKAKGGDYGWWGEEANWVEPFKNAGLMGAKGNISVVETSFGYHIIEVMDVSKTRHSSYRIGQIFKLIAPSDETNQKIFATANQFAGEHNTSELFDKGIEEQKLVKRMGENLKEGDYQVNGLENAKDLIKWVYTANKGDVSIFTLADKHVVAKLSAIKNKGTLPLDVVKEQVIPQVKMAKKAQLFTEEFNKAGNSSMEALAGKLGLQVQVAQNVSYERRMVDGMGEDLPFIGVSYGTKQGAKSRVYTGQNGVFVLEVLKTESDPSTQDLSLKSREIEKTISARVDYEVFNALKEISDIEFHKSRVD